MASSSVKERLTVVTIAYWVMLAYIVAALVWWFISLEQQNQLMTGLRLNNLPAGTAQGQQKRAVILKVQKRKTVQYIGEGFIFLLLILIGAVYIFRATRRQLQLGQQQQNFMMAVTHELKTPIAITILNLETLQKRRLNEQQQQRLVANSLQETARLNDLCNNILLTAQLEAGSRRMQKEVLDLATLAEESIRHFRQRFPDRVFQYEAEGNTVMKGEPVSLQMLINNLLENAVKYAPKNTPVSLNLFRKKDQLLLQVKDEGPGIADAEKKRVFEKFYRIGDERTRTSKGTGLGLYLSRKIMQNHRGEIRLTDNAPQGCIFTALFNG